MALRTILWREESIPFNELTIRGLLTGGIHISSRQPVRKNIWLCPSVSIFRNMDNRNILEFESWFGNAKQIIAKIIHGLLAFQYGI